MSDQHAKTILIVEDHADTSQALQLVLRREGYLILLATSATEGEEMALANEIDLLISDIGLPDRSGWIMMQNIREKKPIRGIALSGFGTENDRSKSIAVGFDEHMTKPYDIVLLKQTLRRLLAPTEME